MIKLTLEWREVLWWLQGGMCGSHVRWSVYEDMVNRVWPQCSEQERRNIFLIMRRDLGTYWRPGDWNGHAHMTDEGEGPWRDEAIGDSELKRFRHVLARYNPDNQYAVTMRVENSGQMDELMGIPRAVIISRPSVALTARDGWESTTATMTVRAYRWEDEYRIDWQRRCADGLVVGKERLNIPDDGTM